MGELQWNKQRTDLMSVIPYDRIANMKLAGLTQKDITIIEDLTRLNFPMSRYLDPLDEAVKQWRKIKVMAAAKQAEENRKNAQANAREASIVRHGGIKSMANGKIYTSQAAYRADLKALGYAEVGTEDTVKEARRIKERENREAKKQSDSHLEQVIAQVVKDARI